MTEERFERAPTFAAYLDGVVKNRELWHEVHARVRLPAELVEAARSLPGRWRLLALFPQAA